MLALLLLSLTWLTINAAPCKHPLNVSNSLQTTIKSQVAGGYQLPVIAFDDIPVGSACHAVQHTCKPPVYSTNREPGYQVIDIPPVFTFSSPPFWVNDQLLHIYPFHYFW